MKLKYYLRGAGFGVIAATVVLSIAFLLHSKNMSDAEVIRRAMELGMIMEESPQGTLADISPQGVTKADLETAADDAGDNADLAQNAGSADNGDTKTPDGNASGDTGTPNDKTPGSTPDANASGNSGTPDNSAAGNTGTPNHAAGNSSAPNAGDKTDGSGTDSDKTDKTNKNTDNKTDDKNNSDKASNEGKEDKDKEDKDKDTVTVEVVGGDVSRVVSGKVQEAGLVEDAEDFNSFMGANGYANNLQPGTYKIKKGATYKQIAEILTSR